MRSVVSTPNSSLMLSGSWETSTDFKLTVRSTRNFFRTWTSHLISWPTLVARSVANWILRCRRCRRHYRRSCRRRCRRYSYAQKINGMIRHTKLVIPFIVMEMVMFNKRTIFQFLKWLLTLAGPRGYPKELSAWRPWLDPMTNTSTTKFTTSMAIPMPSLPKSTPFELLASLICVA